MGFLSKLDNVRISRKFTLVMVLMVVPVVMLSRTLVIGDEVNIEFAKQELAGVRYLKATHQALIAVTKPTPTVAEMAAASIELKKVAAEVSGRIDVTKDLNEVTAELDKGASANIEQAGEKIITLLGDIADKSNIALDPDLNTYYLGDTLTNQGPALVNRLVDVLIAARKMAAEKASGATVDDNDYVVARTQVDTYHDAWNSDIAKALTQDPDGLIKEKLSGIVGQMNAADAALEAADNSQEVSAIIAASARTNALMQQYFAAAGDVETALLEKRIAGFNAQIMNALIENGVLLAISILFAIIIIRSITRPLGVITGLMGRLTQGDLGIEVPKTKRADEVGVLNTALGAMHVSAVERDAAQTAEKERLAKEAKRAEMIQNTIRQFESKIQGIVSTVAAAATELAHTAQQLTKIMVTSTENTNHAVATASETSSNVSSVAAAAEEMAASVREISSQVQKTNDLVRDSQNKTIAADEKAVALSEASSKVRDAVMLISTISSKINLLALNATIESARAGEAGRGFAVVASEVKVLANQTNQSLEDIGKVIEGMDSASSAITQSLSNIKDAVSEVFSASNSIAAAVEEQSATTNEITRNMQNAAQGTNLISENLGTVSQSSHDASAAAGEVLSAAEELSRQAESLNREVNDFLEVMKSA